MTWVEFAREMESIFVGWEIAGYGGGTTVSGGTYVNLQLRLDLRKLTEKKAGRKC